MFETVRASCCLAILCLVSTAALGAGNGVVGYRVTDLGTLGGERSVALSINNSGQIVGYSETAGGQQRAFLYDWSQLRDLGTLGGLESYAHVVNEAGEVVGNAQDARGYYRAFLFSAGVMKDLGSLGGTFSTAWVINNAGQVVGYSMTNCGHQRAFCYSDGTMKDIDMSGGVSDASAINDAGHVVGHFYSEPHGGRKRVFLDTGKSLTLFGSLGGQDTTAAGINNAGQVAGYSETSDGEPHAFLYSDGALKDLGTLPGGTQSFAYAVNNRGQVAGAGDVPGGGLQAFLYSDGTMRNLNGLIPSDSAWILTAARDVNDTGQIVGEGIFKGRQRAFLLTPVFSTHRAGQ